MKLFQTDRGTVLAFGFNMLARWPDPHMISFCDPTSKEWGAAVANEAGSIMVPFKVDPEFVFEGKGGKVIAYQPGICLELTYIGGPLVWSIEYLRPDRRMKDAA